MATFHIQLKKNSPKKRNNKGQSTKPQKTVPYRKIVFVIIPFLIIALIFGGFYMLFLKSPHFVVRHITMIGKDIRASVNYADLERMVIDKNIFSLHLGQIRNYMLENYPELLDLRLERAFPNSLVATITLRKPIAQLFRERYYPVDQEGVILSGVQDRPKKGLPIVHGVRLNLARIIGQKTDSRRIEKALSLLASLNTSGILQEHILVEIDVSSSRNVIFFLEDGLEVKIGHDDFASRLSNLREVLSDPKVRPADIRYIDLRFKEPVIGPKWKR